MIKRKLEKEVELLADENQKAFNIPIILEYYLLESEIDEITELKGNKVFGIEVIKKIKGINDEVISYKDISCSMEKTQNILNRLAINNVTPISFPYIIEDLIGVL